MERTDQVSQPPPFRPAPRGRPRGGPAPPRALPPLPEEYLLFRNASLKRVDWSLALVSYLVYIFVITTYQLRIGDAAIGAALLGLLFLKGSVRIPAVLGLFGLFVLWCALGLATTRYPEVLREQLIDLGKLWLIFLVAVNAVRTRSQIRIFIVLFLLFFALYPARGTIFNYLWGYKVFGRAVWNFIYRNPNDLAAITLLQLSMAVGLLRTELAGWFRRGALAACLVLPLVIIFTQSRGVFLALAVVGAVAALKEVRKVKSILLLAAMAVVIALAAPSSVWQRFSGLAGLTDTENLREVDKEGSAEQRYQIWQVSWQIIADYPLTGTGFGTYPTVHAEYAAMRPDLRYAGGARDTHSTYLNLAATTGIPGLALFLAVVGAGLLHADRVRRRCHRLLPRASLQLLLLELGLVGFLLSGIFASYGKISFLYIHLALLYTVTRACEDDLARLSAGASPARQARALRG